jgi:eukaryotic-like serine/threonine-protein kinase
VTWATFSADGQRVVTASQDGTARIWEAETGQPISPPLRHGQAVRFAVFGPDGYRVLTTCEDDRCRVWDVSPDARPAEDLVTLAELRSGHRIDRTGTVFPLGADEYMRRAETLRTKYPNDIDATPAAARTWRLQQIRDCMSDGDLRAANLHFWWLVAEAALAGK